MEDKIFLKRFLLNDEDFKELYNQNEMKSSFKEMINEVVDYCFDSEFNPYLDKTYQDISWVRNNYTQSIFNLDDIYEVFKNNIEEDRKEVM